MKPRHNQRLIARIRAAAARCRVSLTEWAAMTRTERKRRLAAARGGRRD